MGDAAHTCGNRACVNKRHFRWASRRSNAAEGASHTNDQRGENNKSAKLTADEVRAIRRARATHAVIAARYGIHQTTVSQIKLRKRWAHI
jgi:DNA-binding transcriptional regulator YiaG